MAFYNDSVSNFILIKKFKMILRWYLFIRQPKRLVSFKKWLFTKWVSSKYYFSLKNDYLIKNDVKFNLSFSIWRLFFGSASLYFSKNYGLNYSLGFFNFIDPTEWLVLILENFSYYLFKKILYIL